MHSYNFKVNTTQIISLICLVIILTSQVLAAEGIEQKKSDHSATVFKSSSDPYCGLYCLYTMVKLADRKINFVELFEKEYVSSHKGSSMAQLKKAAEGYGLYSLLIGKLTSRELSQMQYPIILHVKPGLDSQEYNHYELFLGTKDGQAILFDPPNPVRLVPFRELAPRWDGNGLIVSTEPIDFASVVAPARKRFIIYASVVIIAILALHFAKRIIPEKFLNSRVILLTIEFFRFQAA